MRKGNSGVGGGAEPRMRGPAAPLTVSSFPATRGCSGATWGQARTCKAALSSQPHEERVLQGTTGVWWR